MKIKTYKNREILKKSEKCACYYCLSEFNQDEIKEFVDDSETALCPNCGIYSVIGSIQVTDLNLETKKMHINYFCWGFDSDDNKVWIPTKRHQQIIKENPELEKFEYKKE